MDSASDGGVSFRRIRTRRRIFPKICFCKTEIVCNSAQNGAVQNLKSFLKSPSQIASPSQKLDCHAPSLVVYSSFCRKPGFGSRGPQMRIRRKLTPSSDAPPKTTPLSTKSEFLVHSGRNNRHFSKMTKTSGWQNLFFCF